MADVEVTSLGVVHASASADALDRLVVPGRARACRVAEDELLLLCARDDAGEIVREVRDRLGAGDADALVLDVTDGWAAVTLSGRDPRAAFAYLSALELPVDGFVQGEVVRLPAKVVVEADRVHILVPSMVEVHLHDRLRRRLGHPGVRA
ncbi:MAG TPA: hypothetical protein VLX89_08305 [Actinomycetota bacterium]|nr:hypothetical protein [Actinomycetota bacterium]